MNVKYVILFIVVALLSYLGFSYLNKMTQAENLIPETAETVQAKMPEPKPQKEEPKFEEPEIPVVIDTSIYKRDKDGYFDINWKQLSKVEFNEEYVDSLDVYVPFPVFHPEIKYLEGKNIKIKGYVIPIQETGDESILVLSAFPFTNCFFCGGAGPESVMDIKLKKKTKRKYKQDDIITFKGKLRLNDSDLYYLNYILEGAE